MTGGRRAAALVVTVAFLAAGCGSAAQAPSAADRVPRLGALLKRVDDDLAAHHYAAARADLRALKAAVAQARSAGQLSAADATRVLDAVTQVVAALPATTTPTPSTAPSAHATSTSSPHPSESASTRPSRPKSTATQGAVTPSATPTPSSTPSPTASSPSSSPTTQVSPAVATSTPSP